LAFSEMSERYAIGVDLGGTNLRVALVGEEGEILKKIKEPSSGDVPGVLARTVRGLLGPGVAGVGIGVAGIIDRKEMRILTSPNLHSMDGFSFGTLGLDVSLVVENDANAAALGEKWMGAGREYEDFVLLTLGTGIGGGVVYGGKLLEAAAEIGHMSVESGGARCPCGSSGCLENYASARAMIDGAGRALDQGVKSALREYHGGNVHEITPEDIHLAARAGDALAGDVLKTAGKYLGIGIANMINVMSPQAVILTGGLTGAWDTYVAEAVREAGKRAFSQLFGRVEILKSALGGDDAGVLGAAALVFAGGSPEKRAAHV
jgi:glucokinase